MGLAHIVSSVACPITLLIVALIYILSLSSSYLRAVVAVVGVVTVAGTVVGAMVVGVVAVAVVLLESVLL